MTDGPETHNGSNRRSCALYGCAVPLILFILLAGWIASGFFIWKQCEIPLPDKHGKIVYMAKLNKIPSAEWDRKVRIDTNRIKTVKWIPDDISGADPVDVYWYPAKDGKGPFIRFQDPMWEYLVDLNHGITLLVQRYSNGSVSAGEILTPRPLYRDTIDEATGEHIRTVDGRPVRKLEHHVASTPGEYIGRIQYPYNRFVSAKEQPQKPLPKH